LTLPSQKNPFFIKPILMRDMEFLPPLLPFTPILEDLPSVKERDGSWQLEQLIVLSMDKIGSKNRNLPNSTPFFVMGLSAGMFILGK
jgi:hypothetical protein